MTEDEIATIQKFLKFLKFIKEELGKIDESGEQSEWGWFDGETSDEDVHWSFAAIKKGEYDDAAHSLLQNYCDQEGGESRSVEYETEDLAWNLEHFAKELEGELFYAKVNTN